jgi:cyclase
MLKIRVLPTLLHRDVGLVKGVGFKSDRRVGSALQAIRVYNRRGVDELEFFDVSASHAGRPPDFNQIDELADECFMPLTVGGGVRTVEDIRQLLSVGADKVALNTGAILDESLVAEAAGRFGVQCVTVCIDVKPEAGRWRVYSHCGSEPTGLDMVDWAVRCAELGAGEIILTSIERDGTMLGYDIAATRQVVDAVSIPVVASGGAGEFSHMADAVREGGASAVAAASIFHFTEKTPSEAKQYLKEQGLPVRL